MRARIYTRVSTDEQIEGYSLEVQKERCISFVNSQGWELEEIVSDEGYSGYYIDRPGLQKILEDAKEHKFDIVIVYKLDRFSRKLQDLLNILELLSSYDISLKSVTEPFDTLTSHGKLQFQILGSFAEFERNRLKERIFPGMVKGVRNGQWQGGRYPPYGYRYDKNEKKLILVEDEAETVKLIFELALEGLSTVKIAKELTNRKIINIRSNKPFQSSHIGRMLRNPLYTGKIVWNRYSYSKKIKAGKTYKYTPNPTDKWIIGPGRHEPIVSESDFKLVQSILDERAEKLRVKGYTTTGRRNLDSNHILSGIIYCKCGLTMYGERVISNLRAKVYKRRYRCSSKVRYGVVCGEKKTTIYAEKVENEIINILAKFASYPKVIESFSKALEMELINDNPSVKEQYKQYKLQYEKNKKKLKTLIYQFIDTDNVNTDKELIKNIHDEVMEEQKYLEKKMNEIKEQIQKDADNEHIRKFVLLLKDFKKLWKLFDNETKKQFIKTIFKKITIKDGEIDKIILNEPFGSFLKLIEQQEKADGKEKETRVYRNIWLSDEFS